MWVRKYFTIAHIAARNSLQTFHAVFAGNLNTIVVFVALYAAYSTAFAQGGLSTPGASLTNVMWNMATYSLLWAIGARALFNQVNDDVRSGAVETRLAKPYSYIFGEIVQRIGRNFWLFLLQIVLIVVLMLIFVGPPQVAWSPLVAGVFLLSFVMGMMIAFEMYAFFGLTAFWLEDARPVYWIADKSTMILGGAYLPVYLMPTTFRLVAQWSPFGAILSSSQVFHEGFLVRAPLLLLAQVLWVVVFLVGLWLVWSKAVRKLSVNGG